MAGPRLRNLVVTNPNTIGSVFMKTVNLRGLIVAAFAAFVGLPSLGSRASDALLSWNDTAPKKAIMAFVEQVTKSGSPDFVPVPERIATFDNDGTLWAEQPMYFQAIFIFERI